MLSVAVTIVDPSLRQVLRNLVTVGSSITGCWGDGDEEDGEADDFDSLFCNWLEWMGFAEVEVVDIVILFFLFSWIINYQRSKINSKRY